MVTKRGGLELSEEEAYALLGMAMTSPQTLDPTSERALRKLAEFCISRCNSSSSASLAISHGQVQRRLEPIGG